VNKNIVCAYCGSKDPKTMDHIPPRGLFPKPWPDDLVTLPCCESCRSGQSDDDEYFRAVILTSETIGDDPRIEGPMAANVRALQKPQKVGFKHMVLNSLTYTDVITEAGIFIRRAPAIRIDSDRINSVIERIFRGLFYREFNIPVPEDHVMYISLDQHGTRAKAITDKVGGFEDIRWVANRMFAYTFAKAEDREYASIWLGLLYEGVTLIGMIRPKQDDKSSKK
jgi:hypothetical protein